MTLDMMIGLLNLDLKNEWMHLKFYLVTASRLTGLHAHEYKEFFLDAAKSEMAHVQAFQDLIVGLGGEPTIESNHFQLFNDPVQALKYALHMEQKVVSNYVSRQDDAKKLAETDKVNGTWIDVFLDSQIQDSREDADHLKQILKGL